jgi:hypothetical protein
MPHEEATGVDRSGSRTVFVSLTVVLAACDKCGNVFRLDAGPLVCKDERPKP